MHYFKTQLAKHSSRAESSTDTPGGVPEAPLPATKAGAVGGELRGLQTKQGSTSCRRGPGCWAEPCTSQSRTPSLCSTRGVAPTHPAHCLGPPSPSPLCRSQAHPCPSPFLSPLCWPGARLEKVGYPQIRAGWSPQLRVSEASAGPGAVHCLYLWSHSGGAHVCVSKWSACLEQTQHLQG